MVARFGAATPGDEPDASLVMDADVYRHLKRGEIGAQDAFFSGAIRVDGDMEMAIQLALADLAPDL